MASRRAVAKVIGAFCATATSIGVVSAESDQIKTAGGVTAYLGVVPAEIVKGVGRIEPPMHGGIPKGPHEYHFVVALFDAASGARISDAVVTAQVSGLGLSGSKMKLEPMQISGTTTYGSFVNLAGLDLYTVKLTVERGGASPAVLQFRYDHRH